MSEVKRALIEIKGLEKYYHQGGGDDSLVVKAVDGIDLSIEKGDYVAIMGPSGSGKSTLMQILGLLDQKTGGEYFLDGIDVSKLTDAETAKLRCEKIGFIFQFFNLLPRTSALENIVLPMLYRGATEPEGKAREILEKVGLSDRMGHKPHQLSGGQQQRVAIGRALANDPEIIFADEPTGNISSTHQEEVLATLDQLNEEGTTIILVTHEEDVAERARRKIIVRDGIIDEDKRLRPLPELPEKKETEPVGDEAAGTGLLFKRIRENIKMALVALGLNKLRTTLATLGVIIGITSVVTMVGVGEGAQNAISEQLSSLGTNLLSMRAINPKSSFVQGFRKFTLNDLEDLQNLAKRSRYIGEVDGHVYGNVVVARGNKNSNTKLEGSLPTNEKLQNNAPILGRFFNLEENQTRKRVAIIGTTVVNKLFEEGENPIGSEIKINRLVFTVIGVLPSKGATSYTDRDDKIIVPLLTAMRRVLGKSQLNALSAEAKESNLIENARSELKLFLRKQRRLREDAPDDFEVRDMREIKKLYNQTTGIISSMLASIAAVSLLVGGIGIMNVMLVAVKERTREVGLRKALGAQRSDILVQFLIESKLIGLLGGILGILGGYLLSLAAEFFLGFQTFIPVQMVFISFLFSLGVGIIFGLWPAREASLLSPIEALRYE